MKAKAGDRSVGDDPVEALGEAVGVDRLAGGCREHVIVVMQGTG